MTIDEAIKKYRKLSNSDRTCYPEEAAQIAKWLEELKERRETNFDYVSLMDKRYYDGYNKAIDKLLQEIKDWQIDIQDNEYDADKFDFVFERIYEIAEQLKKGGEE